MLELACKTDWADVCRLAGQVHALHAKWRPDIYFETAQPYPQEVFEQDIRNRLVYVAKLEQTVVGYVVLSVQKKEGAGVHPKKLMQIVSICVDETIQGHGIGRAMLEDVQALAKAFGCQGIHLSVHPENDRAVSFYQNCGFTIKTIRMEMNF